jgi:hypothetical protein
VLRNVFERSLALTAVMSLAAVVSGCGSDLTSSDWKLFPSKPQIFSPLESTSTVKAAPDTIASGPVSPEDYIDANGRCGAAASAPLEAAVGTVAGDLGTAAAPQQSAAAPTAPGGIALGMTECQVAAHAGQPAQVNITSGEHNERKVVLTYSSGPWPGIYTFSDGRLKVIDRVAQPEPPKGRKGKSSKSPTAVRPAR